MDVAHTNAVNFLKYTLAAVQCIGRFSNVSVLIQFRIRYDYIKGSSRKFPRPCRARARVRDFCFKCAGLRYQKCGEKENLCKKRHGPKSRDRTALGPRAGNDMSRPNAARSPGHWK